METTLAPQYAKIIAITTDPHLRVPKCANKITENDGKHTIKLLVSWYQSGFAMNLLLN